MLQTNQGHAAENDDEIRIALSINCLIKSTVVFKTRLPGKILLE
ncbi:MAG: hypothetical protein AAGF54_01920 [Pseudomonadota bacterium]